jgi:hypothetical protein
LEPEEFIGQIKKTFSRACALPDWMQQILLEDINAAIENRIRTMELIIQAKPGNMNNNNLKGEQI